MEASTKGQAEGRFHELNGTVKKSSGRLHDNQKLKTEGTCEKITGRVRKKIDRVKKVGVMNQFPQTQ